MIEPSLDRHFRDCGFTLLELLAVVTVLAFASALALPSILQTRQNLRLRAVATNLASDLRLARTQALTENRDTFLILDTGNRTYVTSSMAKKKIIPADFSVSYEIKAAEQLGATKAGVRFRPDGSSSGGRITLRSQAETATVAIDWLTGAISSASR